MSQLQQSFFALLQDAGIRDEGGHFVLAVPASEFSSSINEEMKKGSQFIQEFVTGFNTHVSDRGRLQQCLEPLRTPVGSYEDSLCKVLLNIPSLQTSLMLTLLELIAAHQSDLEGDTDATNTHQTYMERIPIVILDQMRYLYTLVNGDKICHEFSSLIARRYNTPVKREFFHRIPDIFNSESDSHLIAQELTDYILHGDDDQNQSLLLAAVDALSHLQIKQSQIKEVSEHILEKKINEVDLEFLPNLIQFVLQTLPQAEDPKGNANLLRKSLNLKSIREEYQIKMELEKHELFPGQLTSDNNHTEGPEQAERICMEQFYNDMRSRKATQLIFLQVLKEEMERLRELDIWLLFILYSLPQHENKTLSLIKSKIDLGLITTDLIEDSILDRGHALSTFLPDMLKLASHLLSSSSARYWVIASCLFKCLFLTFAVDDPDVSKKLFRIFVSHLGSSNYNEKDCVLQILNDIVKNTDAKLTDFRSFFQGTLDYLHKLDEKQIRLFYSVTGSIACSGTDGNAADIHNQFNIIVRKQLFNPHVTYKRIGIIGMCSLIASELQAADPKGMTSEEQDDESEDDAMVDENAQTTFQLPEDKRSLLLGLFNHALTGCKRPYEQFFLFDEMSRLFNDYPQYSKMIASLFRDKLEQLCMAHTLVIPKTELKASLTHCSMEHELWLDIDTVSSVINVLGEVTSNKTAAASALMADISLLGLVIRLDPSDNSFGKKVLNYPVVGVSSSTVEEIKSSGTKKQKDLLCLSLIGAINWYREALNVVYSTPEMARDRQCHQVALSILNRLAQTEHDLGSILSKHSVFRMPKDCDEFTSQLSETKARLKRIVKASKSSSTSKSKKSKPIVEPDQLVAKYHKYLRDLLPETAEVLSSVEHKHGKVQIQEFNKGCTYLLKDMDTKLQACLDSLRKASKKRTRSSSNHREERMLQTGGTASAYIHRISQLISVLIIQITPITKEYNEIVERSDDEDKMDVDDAEEEVILEGVSTTLLRKQLVLIFDVLQKLFAYYHLFSTPKEIRQCNRTLTGFFNKDELDEEDEFSDDEDEERLHLSGFSALLQNLQRLSGFCASKTNISVHWLHLLAQLADNIVGDSRTCVSEAATSILSHSVTLTKKEISYVVQCTLRYTRSKRQLLSKLVETILFVIENPKEPPEFYSNITCRNVEIYYVAVLEEIANYFKTFASDADHESNDGIRDEMRTLSKFVDTFAKLAESAKNDMTKKKAYQVAISRFTRFILKRFNENCFKFLELQITMGSNVDENKEQVQKILTSLNQAIRTVHTILLDNKSKKSKLLQYNADVVKEIERFRGGVNRIFSESDIRVKNKAFENQGSYDDIMQIEEEEEEDDDTDVSDSGSEEEEEKPAPKPRPKKQVEADSLSDEEDSDASESSNAAEEMKEEESDSDSDMEEPHTSREKLKQQANLSKEEEEEDFDLTSSGEESERGK